MVQKPEVKASSTGKKIEKTDPVVIAVVGLGYVGLPLALAFGRTELVTYGFDVKEKRVKELQNGLDSTGELNKEEIKSSRTIFTNDESELKKANFIIVAVPTPVNQANQPDLRIIEQASETVGRNLQPGSIVVFESTVYPGVTEEVCAPILERVSGLKLGKDFKIGYSPERINPGDKEHTLEKITKVVAGMDGATTAKMASVYGRVCLAGVFLAKNIKTAEAAKVIENTQRDLNIALVNELSLIFHRLGIETSDVLEAAGTKWNFLRFTPGLVGGHCIGVDPYYLVHKAEELGYHPQVIAAGRRVNDFMPEFVAQETLSGLIEAGAIIQNAKVLVVGLTFKENVKDTRNSRIILTIDKLKRLGMQVVGFDPLVNLKDIKNEFQIPAVPKIRGNYDAIVIATPHRQILAMEKEILRAMKNPVVMDVRGVFAKWREQPGIIYRSL